MLDKQLKVPFNDTSRTYSQYARKINNAIQNVASSGWWLMGRETAAFAEEFAEYCNAKHCLPVANGTDALEIALRATLGDKRSEEHEVITVANAGGYTTTACRLIGLTPVYVDVHKSTLLIDFRSVIDAMSSKVSAVVVTHLFGGAVDVVKLRSKLDAAGYSNVCIIEDCAQAHGAKLHGTPVGAFGDIATFSFYPTKNLGAMGDAGAIVTQNTELFEYASALSQYGWSRKYEVLLSPARNSRMDEIQAAILRTLLPHLDEQNEKRKAIYAQYAETLKSTCMYERALDHGGDDFISHLSVITTNQRDELRAFLSRYRIATDIHYPVLDFDQLAWRTLPMRLDEVSQLSTSKEITAQILSIPCFPTMTASEIEYVCYAFKCWGGDHAQK